MGFAAIRIDFDRPEDRASVLDALARRPGPPALVLDTCQRLEVYADDPPDLPGFRVQTLAADASAFERLARIAAGLESRILGELEILGQVRTAYRQFRESHDTSSLDRVFQDALALARKARRESGIDRQLISLGALAARTLLDRVPAGAPLAVVGAGDLAGSVARYLAKPGDAPVRIGSRCPDNALRLARRLGAFGAGLDDLHHLLDGAAGIITATAAPHPVLYLHHLDRAADDLVIVDMGVPADCAPEIAARPHTTYIPLETIEAQAHGNVEDRRRRADRAGRIIREGAQAWSRRQPSA